MNIEFYEPEILTRLPKSIKIRVNWYQVDICYHTLENYWKGQPNDGNKALRIEHVLKLFETLRKWRNNTKFFNRQHKNEHLIDVTIPYQQAVLLFEVALYSNHFIHLKDMMAMIYKELARHYTIFLPIDKIPL